MASVKRRCCGVSWTPGASSWWLSTCPDLRAQGAWLGKFWVLLPQLVRLDYCWVALWGVSCLSSTAIVSYVVTMDVAAPEYDNDEGGSFAFETFNFDQALES